MPDPALLQLEGAPANRPFRKVPLANQNFFSGLVTQRSPFSSLDNRYNRRYLGGRPDQLIDGLNMEISNYATVIRRAGTTAFFTQSVSENSINSFYSFHQLAGNITVMMDTTSHVYTVAQNQAPVSIFTKSLNAGQTFFQGVGNTLYMGDGSDQVAWNPSQSSLTRNWGISNAGLGSSSSAYAGTATDLGGGSPSPVPWVNPGNATGAPNAAYATNTVSIAPHQPLSKGNYLGLSNYGLSIPSQNTVTGIQVALTGFVSLISVFKVYVALQTNGSIIGNLKQVGFSTSSSTITLGSSTDTWGSSLNSTIVNSGNFGVQIVISGSNGTSGSATVTLNIDAAQITVFDAGGPVVTVSPSAGTFSAVNGGYQYVVAYGNSASGHVSNPTPPSNLTGNFANKLNVQIPVTASTDPQVNQIRVYRTKDGGSVYYELPTSPYPNTTTTILDNNADSTLNTLVFWPSIPWIGNSPPPAGVVNLTYHLGRIWGSVGNFVYYSGGPDTLIGNGNEAWPPANFFLMPSQVNRLVPYSSGLLVFTTDDVYLILGTSLATFYAVIFQQGVGLLSYNALDILGTNIFLYTSDRQFLSLSSAGFSELGFAIGDKLQLNFDPAKVYVAAIVQGTSEKAVYVSDGVDDWYRCNWNQAPEGGPAWSPLATITGGSFALTSVETTPGIHQLLMGFTQFGIGNLGVAYRDTSGNFQDVSAGGGLNPYDSFITFGSFILANAGQAAEVDSITIENINVGLAPNIPAVSVLIDEISGPFELLPNFTNDPPELTPSITVLSNRWYLSQGANAARLRHMQIKVDFGQNLAKDELLTVSIFGGLIHQS